jgi:hypothetical protein
MKQRIRDSRTAFTGREDPAPAERDAHLAQRVRYFDRHREATEMHDDRHDDHGSNRTQDRDSHADAETLQRQKYGGFNIGAAFFGWLVANSVAVLSIALLTALGSAVALTQTSGTNELAQNAGTIGLTGAIGLLVSLAIAYYAGGYVAGRMSRFDGGRQGLGTWLMGLVATIGLGLLGAILGSNFNLLQQLNVPSLPVDGSSFSTAGLVTLLASLVLTALAAIAGGKAGERYHRKVDAVAHEAEHGGQFAGGQHSPSY